MLPNIFTARLDQLRLRHALKTGIACLIGWIIMHFMHNANSQWILITIIVVMSAQLNVGSLVQKARMRFLGTVCGAAVALLTLILPGNHLSVLTPIISIAAITAFTYIAANNNDTSYLGTLGAVTVVIILLGQQPSLSTALIRISEISIGILVSLLVSIGLFPLRASRLLQKTLVNLISNLQTFFTLALNARKHTESDQAFHQMEEQVRQQLAACRKLHQETLREPGRKKFSVKQLRAIEHQLREIIRGILHIHHCLAQLAPEKNFPDEDQTITLLEKTLHKQLENLAILMTQKKTIYFTI